MSAPVLTFTPPRQNVQNVLRYLRKHGPVESLPASYFRVHKTANDAGWTRYTRTDPQLIELTEVGQRVAKWVVEQDKLARGAAA